MSTFFVVFLPNEEVEDSSKEDNACSGHYVVLAIYKTFRHVSIYSSGINQEGVLDVIKPKIIDFLNKVLVNEDNVTFTDCQDPTEIPDDPNKWTIGLYLNLTIDSPVCGPMVLWCIIHIHLKLHINDEDHIQGCMDIWVLTYLRNIRVTVVQHLLFC